MDMYATLAILTVIVIAIGIWVQMSATQNGQITMDSSALMARNAVLESPTYLFDGYELVSKGGENSGCSNCWTFRFEFKSGHLGYGDRKGQELAEAVTLHRATIVIRDGETSRADLDGVWDMMNDRFIEGRAPQPGEGDGPGIANPASVFCSNLGGTLNISSSDSGQIGYCSLPDGRVCEEWELFRSRGASCVRPTVPAPTEAFCGWSTNGTCMNDQGCIRMGCSGQVCIAKNENYPVTTCEWRGCYNATAYGLGCRCVSNRCGWSG